MGRIHGKENEGSKNGKGRRGYAPGGARGIFVGEGSKALGEEAAHGHWTRCGMFGANDGDNAGGKHRLQEALVLAVCLEQKFVRRKIDTWDIHRQHGVVFAIYDEQYGHSAAVPIPASFNAALVGLVLVEEGEHRMEGRR